MIKLHQTNGSAPIWVQPDRINCIRECPLYGTAIYVGDRLFFVQESAEEVLKQTHACRLHDGKCVPFTKTGEE